MIALTHVPSPALQAGERTYIERAEIDHALAARQHAGYCEALRECGFDVHTLTGNAHLADATFIEDTAVVLDEVAILTSLGAESRRAELALVKEVLRELRPLRRVELPARLEGGDVLRVGRTLIVGLSQRTNGAGVATLEQIVVPLGYRVIAVPVTSCLHLKTAMTALPDGRLWINRQWIDATLLAEFSSLSVPSTEPWGGNLLLAGNTIILPAAHEQSAAILAREGFRVRPVELSEFAKAEGGVTCLSLLLNVAFRSAKERPE